MTEVFSFLKCVQYAELETILGDTERARSILELAINQPRLDMPEVLWKAYIDFEVDQEEYENARKLYKRLLQRTQHVKVGLLVYTHSLQFSGSTLDCSIWARLFEKSRSPSVDFYSVVGGFRKQ